MLVSPIRIHELLAGILEPDEEQGPHTALLITPPGQLLAHATVPDEDEGDGESDGEGPNGRGGGEGDEGSVGEDGDEEDGSVSDEEDDDNDEPYLEGPERLRLLLGLASQWEDDESPRVECELGRLFLRPITLPEPETAPPNAAIPAVRPPFISSFVLVLNGTARTPWSQLAQKADAFLSKW